MFFLSQQKENFSNFSTQINWNIARCSFSRKSNKKKEKSLFSHFHPIFQQYYSFPLFQWSTRIGLIIYLFDNFLYSSKYNKKKIRKRKKNFWIKKQKSICLLHFKLLSLSFLPFFHLFECLKQTLSLLQSLHYLPFLFSSSIRFFTRTTCW